MEHITDFSNVNGKSQKLWRSYINIYEYQLELGFIRHKIKKDKYSIGVPLCGFSRMDVI